jgi:hypothetical protein
VYDASHLGHARNYISFDVLRRVMTSYFGRAPAAAPAACMMRESWCKAPSGHGGAAACASA